MTSKQKRLIAEGAVRGTLHKQGRDPRTVDANSAWAVLDNLARIDSRLVAADFYYNASEAQADIFFKEWAAFCKTGKIAC